MATVCVAAMATTTTALYCILVMSLVRVCAALNGLKSLSSGCILVSWLDCLKFQLSCFRLCFDYVSTKFQLSFDLGDWCSLLYGILTSSNLKVHVSLLMLCSHSDLFIPIFWYQFFRFQMFACIFVCFPNISYIYKFPNREHIVVNCSSTV